MKPTDAPPLWRNHDFMLVWMGQTASAVGSSMSYFVYPLAGYALTGSVSHAALTGSLYLASRVITQLPAGVVVDRYDRRIVMTAALLCGFLCYAALTSTILFGTATLAHLLFAATVTGILSAFSGPVETATVRQVVPPHQLPAALSQFQARQHAASLVGPPLGGLLFAVAPWMPFLVDSFTYLIAMGAVLLLRAKPAAPVAKRQGRGRGMVADCVEGVRFVLGRSFFRAVALSALLVNCGATALLVVITLKLLRAGVHPAAIGTIEAVAAVAGLGGAMIAPLLIRRIATGKVVGAGCWLIPVGVLPIAWTNSVVAVGALLAVALLALPAVNVSTDAYLVAVTPDELQGRVSSGLKFTSTLAQPGGPALGGAMLGAFGGQTAVLTTVVLTTLGVAVLATCSEVRRLPTPDQWQATLRSNQARSAGP